MHVNGWCLGPDPTGGAYSALPEYTKCHHLDVLFIKMFHWAKPLPAQQLRWLDQRLVHGSFFDLVFQQMPIYHYSAVNILALAAPLPEVSSYPYILSWSLYSRLIWMWINDRPLFFFIFIISICKKSPTTFVVDSMNYEYRLKRYDVMNSKDATNFSTYYLFIERNPRVSLHVFGEARASLHVFLNCFNLSLVEFRSDYETNWITSTLVFKSISYF